MLFSQSPRDDLSDIQDLHRRFRLFLSGFFRKHPHAKRAACGHRLRAGLFEFSIAVGAYTLIALLLFFPKLTASGAAAKALRAGALGLGEPGARRFDEDTGRIENSVVPAEIAGIMKRDLAVGGRRKFNFALSDDLVDEIGVMLHDIVAAELGVLVGDRVKAMGASRHDRFGLNLV